MNLIFFGLSLIILVTLFFLGLFFHNIRIVLWVICVICVITLGIFYAKVLWPFTQPCQILINQLVNVDEPCKKEIDLQAKIKEEYHIWLYLDEYRKQESIAYEECKISCIVQDYYGKNILTETISILTTNEYNSYQIGSIFLKANENISITLEVHKPSKIIALWKPQFKIGINCIK